MFGPLTEDDEKMGALVETAIVAQLMHSSEVKNYYFARWAEGEVDLVHCSPQGNPMQAFEIKWSDRVERDTSVTKSVISFSRKNNIQDSFITTKSVTKTIPWDNTELSVVTSAFLCRLLGDLLRQDLAGGIHPRRLLPEE